MKDSKDITFKISAPLKVGNQYKCQIETALFSREKSIIGETADEATKLAEEFCSRFGTVISVKRHIPIMLSNPIAIKGAELFLTIVVSVAIIVWDYIVKNTSKEEECDAQYDKEVRVCKVLKDTRMRKSCESQAANRYAACLRGHPMPPFIW